MSLHRRVTPQSAMGRTNNTQYIFNIHASSLFFDTESTLCQLESFIFECFKLLSKEEIKEMCILFLYQIKSYIITTCDNYIPSRRSSCDIQDYKYSMQSLHNPSSAPAIVVQCAIAYIHLVPELTSPAVFSCYKKNDKKTH